MKRILSFALVLLLAISLLGCSSNNNNDSEAEITGYVMSKEEILIRYAG